LYIQGRHVVDSVGHVIHLKGVNWYGAHMEQFVNNGLDKRNLADLVRIIKTMGFNSVRLNYGVEQWLRNPPVNDRFLAMNPALKGKTTMEIFDACVEAITSAGLLVVINNHVSTNRWCCSHTDTNSLWYNKDFGEDKWLQSLSDMARRYKRNKRVIGYDIRNEPRADLSTKEEVTAVWWNPPNRTAADWRKASIEGSKAVWQGNPQALVFIEGLAGAFHWFASKEGSKIEFSQPCLSSRIAYSAHDYPWIYGDDILSKDYNAFKSLRSLHWAFLLEEDTAPVWIGEFGAGMQRGKWWRYFLKYAKDMDLDFAYWTLDGYKYPAGIAVNASYMDSMQKLPTRGLLSAPIEETFGLLNSDYTSVRDPAKLLELQNVLSSSSKGLQTLKKPGSCVFDAALNPVVGTGPRPWSIKILHVVASLATLTMACCAVCMTNAWRASRKTSSHA
jgi:endoglucanase